MIGSDSGSVPPSIPPGIGIGLELALIGVDSTYHWHTRTTMSESGKKKAMHSLREKHAAEMEELNKLLKESDGKAKIIHVLRDKMLTEEARAMFREHVVGNPTICRARPKLMDHKSYPPKSTRRRSLCLNGFSAEMKIIGRLDLSDEDRMVMEDLAKVRWNLVTQADIDELGSEAGDPEFQQFMDSKQGDIRNELRIQGLWNATDVCVLGFAGVMAISVLFDGGLTLAAVMEAGLWSGVGYAGHKAIKHRDELGAKLQDFAASHGWKNPVQARVAAMTDAQ